MVPGEATAIADLRATIRQRSRRRAAVHVPTATLAAALALLLTAPALAVGAPTGAINEYSSGLGASAEPEAIAPGPEGNMWFIDAGSSLLIGRVTPSGGITEFSGVGGGHDLEDIATGPEGDLWFTDDLTGHSGGIWRSTPAGAISELAGDEANPGRAITAGPEGNMWFVASGGAATAIGKVTPGGQITEYTSGLKAGSALSDIALGPDGDIWFTDRGERAIGRITPGGTITEFTSGLNAGSLPDGIAAGPDGNVWFTDSGTTKAIGKITPGGTITEYSTGLNAGSDPVNIAPGADGNVWFADDGTTQAVGRITPGGTISEYSEGLNQVSRTLDLAPGSDGSIWFTKSTAPQAIGRIGTGAPEVPASPLAVTGGGQVGSTQLCSTSWPTWAGQQPSATLYGFDGYRWSLDGTQVATGPSYTPTAASVGHQLSCAETATYPLLQVSESAASAPITVTAPISPLVPGTAPAITDLRASPSRWREGGKLAQISRRRKRKPLPVGTTFSFSLNESATVLLEFTQTTGGRKAGKSCVAPTRRNRHSPTCKRTVTVGTLSFTGHTGTNKVRFDGRLSRTRKLQPGRYTLVVTATNASRQASAAQRLTFTIVR